MVSVIACVACQAQSGNPTEMIGSNVLFPYLGADGRYGYADSSLKIVIPLQYSSAELFDSNGLAVVRNEDGKYGVIDTDNRLLVPFERERFRLFTVGDQTLMESSTQYTNSLRFWEWRFWPGFSLTGGGTDKRLFDTNVRREKVTLKWLGKNKVIKTRRGAAGAFHLRFRIRHLGENRVLVDNDLYKIDRNSSNKLANDIENIVNDQWLLQYSAKGYRLLTTNGEPLGRGWLQSLAEIDLNINQQKHTLLIKKHDKFGLHTKGDFYRDDENNTFVSGDFDKVFPTNIQEYVGSDTLSARNILDKSRYISPISGTDRFMIVSSDLKTLVALDTEGHWHPAEEHYNDFRIVSAARTAILWPPHSHFLNEQDIPSGWEVHRVAEFNVDEWYKISIRQDKKRLQGLWDKTRKVWVLAPEYYAVNRLGSAEQFISFQSVEKGKWGVYDLKEQRIHIPEIYHSISPDGMVQLIESNQRLTFYLDVETRREFRDKRPTSQR